VLHSANHLPPAWKGRFGGWIDWTWAFVLADLGDGRTRFIFSTTSATGERVDLGDDFGWARWGGCGPGGRSSGGSGGAEHLVQGDGL
jgi:hypothetical protein